MTTHDYRATRCQESSCRLHEQPIFLNHWRWERWWIWWNHGCFRKWQLSVDHFQCIGIHVPQIEWLRSRGHVWHSEISACLKIGYPQNYCLIIIIITIFWQVPAHVAASSPKLMQCMTRVELDSWYSLTVYQADLLPHPQTKQKMCWPIWSTVLHAELGQTVLTRSFSGVIWFIFHHTPQKKIEGSYPAKVTSSWKFYVLPLLQVA